MIGAVLSNVVFRTFGYLYPAYVTYKDMKARNARRIYLWSMYWVILGFFTAALPFLDAFVGFLPLYHEVRALFPLLLWYPDLQGAESVWRRHLDPFLASREASLDARIEAAKRAGAEAARGGADAVALLARQHGVAALLWVRSAVLAALAGAVAALDAQRGTVVFQEIQGGGAMVQAPASTPPGAGAPPMAGAPSGSGWSAAALAGSLAALGASSPFGGAAAQQQQQQQRQPSASSPQGARGASAARAPSAARSGSSALPPLVDVGEDSFASQGRAPSQRAGSGGLFGGVGGVPTSLPSVSRAWNSVTGGMAPAAAGAGAGGAAAAAASAGGAGAGAGGAPSPLSAPSGSWSAAAASAWGALAGFGSGAITPVVAAVMSSGGRSGERDGADRAGGPRAGGAASPARRASPRPPSPAGSGSPLRDASPSGAAAAAAAGGAWAASSPAHGRVHFARDDAGAQGPGRDGSLGLGPPPRHSQSTPALDGSAAQSNAYAALQSQRAAARGDDPFGWLEQDMAGGGPVAGGAPPMGGPPMAYGAPPAGGPSVAYGAPPAGGPPVAGGRAPPPSASPFSGSAWSDGGSDRVLYPEVVPLRHDDPYVADGDQALGRAGPDGQPRGLSGQGVRQRGGR